MNEQQFQQIAEKTIENLQDAIDNSGAAIDYDEIGGVLTLEFDSNAKIIFSKQIASYQLWMAAPTGGYHFDYDMQKKQWLCNSGEKLELSKMLSQFSSELTGDIVTINLAD